MCKRVIFWKCKSWHWPMWRIPVFFQTQKTKKTIKKCVISKPCIHTYTFLNCFFGFLGLKKNWNSSHAISTFTPEPSKPKKTKKQFNNVYFQNYKPKKPKKPFKNVFPQRSVRIPSHLHTNCCSQPSVCCKCVRIIGLDCLQAMFTLQWFCASFTFSIQNI